jgi:hypothetical protein
MILISIVRGENKKGKNHILEFSTTTKRFLPMSILELTMTILQKMPDISKWQLEFLLHNFEHQCSIRGKHNFMNMSRYSTKNESTYRSNYGKEFAFEQFNYELITGSLSNEKAVAFDPSYISKSGRKTPGCGYFWSGCAGHTKWGLEIGGFAALDIKQNTALHYIADQTLGVEEHSNLLAYYAALVCRRSEAILAVSKYLVVDAYFSRYPFVSAVCEQNIEVISRLRDDADLRYPYIGAHPKRRGPKRKFQGKFDARNLDESHFTCCLIQKDEQKKEDYALYEARLYSKALKRYIRVVVQHNFDVNGDLKSHKLFFSTDTTLSGIDIFLYYKTRFQIEFLYRDAKQHVGLEDCQSRSETKLHFHFNTALTTISLAKVAYHLNVPEQQRGAFSMADIKTEFANQKILDLIINECGKEPHPTIIKSIEKIKTKILDFGRINDRRA